MINRFFECAGRAPCAVTHDLLRGAPPVGEVVLLLKVLPCLEQQEKGASESLIGRLADEGSVRMVVASFPSRSLGGHGRGMARHYRDFIESVAGGLGLGFEAMSFSTEVFYVFRVR